MVNVACKIKRINDDSIVITICDYKNGDILRRLLEYDSENVKASMRYIGDKTNRINKIIGFDVVYYGNRTDLIEKGN